MWRVGCCRSISTVRIQNLVQSETRLALSRYRAEHRTFCVNSQHLRMSSASPLEAEASFISESSHTPGRVHPVSHEVVASGSYATSIEPHRRFDEGDIISVAPMMEWTDRHYRFLVRLLSKRIRLYTEMVVENTLRYSPLADAYLRFHPSEHPIACQIGGSDPANLAAAARMVEAAGYDEINLNCGCPSPKVAGKGCFGAALMKDPALVRDCVAAMRAAVSIPVTVKCRLGVDALDTYEHFTAFLRIVSESGVTHFLVHARKAFLKGLDPKANRTVPPLRYHWVQRAALEFPHLRISINGGITTLEQMEQLLSLQRRGPALVFPPLPTWPNKGERGEGKEGKDERGSRPASPAADGEDCCPASSDAPAAAPLAPASTSNSYIQDARPAGERYAVEDEEAYRARMYAAWRTEKVRRAAHDAVVGRIPPEQFYEGVGQGPLVLPAGQGRGQEGTAAQAQGGEGRVRYGTREHVLDSVMIGRAAYNSSWMLSDVDRRLFGVANPGHSRREILELYCQYAEGLLQAVPEAEKGMLMHRPFELAKPLFGLFAGEYGCGKFRLALIKALTEGDKLPFREALSRACTCLPAEVLDERPPV